MKGISMIFQARLHEGRFPGSSVTTWRAATHFAGHHCAGFAPDAHGALQSLCNALARTIDPSLQDSGYTRVDLAPGRVELYVPALTTPDVDLTESL